MVRCSIHQILEIIRQERNESEKVGRSLKMLVRPSEKGLKVKKIGSIKNRELIQTEDEEGSDKLLKSDTRCWTESDQAGEEEKSHRGVQCEFGTIRPIGGGRR
ncbi:hypothetical protein J6590_037256 [Homalodisca vitripennis]|nr:hypothetical protein J6590_037256 [Homalodisca vitripennis]